MEGSQELQVLHSEWPNESAVPRWRLGAPTASTLGPERKSKCQRAPGVHRITAVCFQILVKRALTVKSESYCFKAARISNKLDHASWEFQAAHAEVLDVAYSSRPICAGKLKNSTSPPGSTQQKHLPECMEFQI